MLRAHRRLRGKALLRGGVLLALAGSGCVERYLRVDTEPAGVTVFVDGEYVGETPVERPFTYYGTVRVDLACRGYRSRTELVPLERPWYQWFPLDLVSEMLSPYTHVDRHHVHFQLEEVDRGVEPTSLEALREPDPELLQSADQLRTKVR